MKYEVIVEYIDLDDSKHRYKVGDKYPRDGYTPSEKRIAFLCGITDKRNFALIKPVKEETVEEVKPKKRSRKASSK